MVTELSERINDFLEQSEMDRKEFVKQMGYENITKGLRRLDSWRNSPGRRKAYPTSDDQLQRLAAVLPASVPELKKLLHWEKLARRIEKLEARRRKNEYYFSLQTHKFWSQEEKFSGDLEEDEVFEKVRSIIAEELEKAVAANDRLFRAELNTPECKSYYFNKQGEITKTKTARAAPGVHGLKLM